MLESCERGKCAELIEQSRDLYRFCGMFAKSLGYVLILFCDFSRSTSNRAMAIMISHVVNF
jgi:hypothetical protein